MVEVNDPERALADEREDRDMVHVHTFSTITFVADGHQHIVMGTSAPARSAGQSHIHRLRVRTSFFSDDDTGHWHWFDVLSGPAIYTTDGGHVHVYEGVTSVDDRHSHDVANTTAEAPDISEAGAVVAPSITSAKVKNKSMKR
jgi:hypothetical protein